MKKVKLTHSLMKAQMMGQQIEQYVWYEYDANTFCCFATECCCFLQIKSVTVESSDGT